MAKNDQPIGVAYRYPGIMGSLEAPHVPEGISLNSEADQLTYEIERLNRVLNRKVDEHTSLRKHMEKLIAWSAKASTILVNSDPTYRELTDEIQTIFNGISTWEQWAFASSYTP